MEELSAVNPTKRPFLIQYHRDISYFEVELGIQKVKVDGGVEVLEDVREPMHIMLRGKL